MWTARVIQNSIKLNIQRVAWCMKNFQQWNLNVGIQLLNLHGFRVWSPEHIWTLENNRKHWLRKRLSSQFVPSTSIHNNLLRILNRRVSFCLLRLLMFRRFTDLEFHLGVRNTYKLWRPVKDGHFHTASYSHCASRLSLTTLMIFLAFPETHDGSLD